MTLSPIERGNLVSRVIYRLGVFLKLDPLDDTYPHVCNPARTFLDGDGALDEFARQRLVRLARSDQAAYRMLIQLRADSSTSVSARRAADVLKAANPKPRF